MERTQIELEDSRRLDVASAGPEDGTAVLFHTGTPGEGIVYEGLIEEGAVRGLRHISYSRPGYGRSDRKRGRTVADCVIDVEAIADAFGIERFHTVGWSGGGPHALACAALLPERTIAAATLAGVAPCDVPGLDWLAGMGDENIEEFAAARAGEEQLAAYVEAQRPGMSAVTAEELRAGMGDLLSPIDQTMMSGEFAEYIASVFKGAMSEGPWGWVDDDFAFLCDWGFDLAAIERPVTIWQGPEDRMVPYEHGKWLAEHVAGAQPRLLDGEGHLSILLGAYGRVLDELLASG
ncbi:MAG TPA: alpha/beta hydrolase [Solirubrobacteraceae bacterium]|jgi:pimeloyl-ACP methyl ester carboxylesterase|nr:alpha/beta hydrolase [Solirubrobacteraceae bacterium]